MPKYRVTLFVEREVEVEAADPRRAREKAEATVAPHEMLHTCPEDYSFAAGEDWVQQLDGKWCEVSHDGESPAQVFLKTRYGCVFPPDHYNELQKRARIMGGRDWNWSSTARAHCFIMSAPPNPEQVAFLEQEVEEPGKPPVRPQESCTFCPGNGVIETGNNDLPCSCPAGQTAMFNDVTLGLVTGAEMRRRMFITHTKTRGDDE